RKQDRGRVWAQNVVKKPKKRAKKHNLALAKGAEIYYHILCLSALVRVPAFLCEIPGAIGVFRRRKDFLQLPQPAFQPFANAE
ncbi:MAG: hypothetical protein J6V10_08985, partial [Clostridia bacterium]|nr:hypothetical protein [Clostridia bacterium]